MLFCCSFLRHSFSIFSLFLVSLFIKHRRGMNVNAVWALVAFTAKKSMLVHRVLAQTMAFVLIYLKDMMAIHTSVYALTVSIYLRAFYFFPSFVFVLAVPFHSCTFINFFSIYIHSMTTVVVVEWNAMRWWCKCCVAGNNRSPIRLVSTSFILLLILFVPYWWIQINSNTHIKWMNLLLLDTSSEIYAEIRTRKQMA